MPKSRSSHKKLHLSKNKVVAGVCAGIAEYLDIDPTIVRLITAAIILTSGIFPGVVLYVIGMVIIPEN